MKTINVKLVKQIDDSYPIYIKQNILEQITDILKANSLGNKYLIISDSNVKEYYGDKLYNLLKDKDFNVYLFTFPAGEEQKNIKTKLDIEKFMFENQFTRDSIILALGGGVVGDIAGFTASTFNRGIPYIQIPTSLVSQVDSSIGGKTAIDVPYGKNLIGTFYQPKMVIIDPLVLKTLPEKEYFSGMAEVIKHAIIRDKELFNYLNQEKKAIINRDLDVLEKIIEINCNIKRQIVEEDEKESNLRKILNYGHTIGHAVEKIMDYQLLHGECVAMGMAVEAEISSRMGYLNSNEVKEIEELIKTFNLPITIPKGIAEITIYQTTLLDKKSIKNEPHYSLPKKLGEMVSLQNSYGITVERSTVIETIRTNQLKQS